MDTKKSEASLSLTGRSSTADSSQAGGVSKMYFVNERRQQSGKQDTKTYKGYTKKDKPGMIIPSLSVCILITVWRSNPIMNFCVFMSFSWFLFLICFIIYCLFFILFLLKPLLFRYWINTQSWCRDQKLFKCTKSKYKQFCKSPIKASFISIRCSRRS